MLLFFSRYGSYPTANEVSFYSNVCVISCCFRVYYEQMLHYNIIQVWFSPDMVLFSTANEVWYFSIVCLISCCFTVYLCVNASLQKLHRYGFSPDMILLQCKRVWVYSSVRFFICSRVYSHANASLKN